MSSGRSNRPSGDHGPRKRPGPRPVTASYLRNAAMHYISAHSASIAMVRQTLERRACRRLCVTTLDEATRNLIEVAIAEIVNLGLVDDARFAEGRARVLARRGLPQRRIMQGLRSKGLDRETIAQTTGHVVDELAQARRYVERKRLGPYRRGGVTPDSRRKDLAALGRAGFSRATAVKALDEADDT